MADTWTISPLIRPLPRKLDERGGCAYPQDFPHCHGAEIQHTDGTAECFNPGQPCPYPRPGVERRLNHSAVAPPERQRGVVM